VAKTAIFPQNGNGEKISLDKIFEIN